MATKSIKIYSDGGARGNPGPAAAAFVVISDGRVNYKKAKYLGEATNNVAEYCGVLMALDWLVKDKVVSVKKIGFYLDSELVANQLSGNYKVKNENLKTLILKIKKLEEKSGINIVYKSVPRSKNKLADYLVNEVLDEN
ncbi:MAG: ribonuclease HI family protein [Patescibacteria group bacterium]